MKLVETRVLAHDVSITNRWRGEDGIWEVKLTPAEEQELIDQMTLCLRQYGLDDWSVVWLDRRNSTREGDCCSGTKTIRLLRPATVRGLWDTFFHELAHALTPSCSGWDADKGHGAAWYKVCVMLGGSIGYEDGEGISNMRLAADRKDAFAARRAQQVLVELEKRGTLSGDDVARLFKWGWRQGHRRSGDILFHLVYKMNVAEWVGKGCYSIRLKTLAANAGG
jgi:hypothetical protein